MENRKGRGLIEQQTVYWVELKIMGMEGKKSIDYFPDHGAETTEMVTCSSSFSPFWCQVADDDFVIDKFLEEDPHNQGLFVSKGAMDEEFPDRGDPHVVSVVDFVGLHPGYEFWDRNLEFELIDYR